MRNRDHYDEFKTTWEDEENQRAVDITIDYMVEAYEPQTWNNPESGGGVNINYITIDKVHYFNTGYVNFEDQSEDYSVEVEGRDIPEKDKKEILDSLYDWLAEQYSAKVSFSNQDIIEDQIRQEASDACKDNRY